jgi:hypothetical protein
MEKYRIPLTDAEEALVAKIDLSLSHRNHDEAHAAYNANAEPILALLALLSERDGVPSQRVRYWNDIEYNPGRIKTSRKGEFERNNCLGEDIYIHPHFIKHLRYILLGADLPGPIILDFEQQVGNPEWVSLSDAIPMGKHARKLVRQYGLEARHASEEFFKLCLDMGLKLSVALSIMRSVRQVR